MNPRSLLFALALSPLVWAQATPPPPPPVSMETWPREADALGFHLVIYQPQVDSWKKDQLQARAAVTATRPPSTVEAFGIVTLTARTEVEKDLRIVMLHDLKVTSANFPGAKPAEGNLEQAVRESVSTWARTVSLDRLLADLAITGAEMEPQATAPLKSDPPRIIFSQVSSVLVIVDGEPALKAVEGSTRYQRVINTPALLVYDTSASRYYLDGGSLWMTAPNLTNGPWTLANNPPADLAAIRSQVVAAEDKDPHDHSKDAAPPPVGAPAAVFVSTTPAELIQTTGAPQYSPIAKTDLAYVTNTSSNVFRDAKTQDIYVLIAGRWYQSKSPAGPWASIAGAKLPKDFTKIPPDHPKASVLVSIPGTEQAREAVIANQIPQTAEVKRNQAKLNVTYDGAPQFQPIAGTSMEYGVNTSYDVIHAGPGYYSAYNGVWFTAGGPLGPWVVADSIPPEIYSIPPSNPLYHDRFVYVYGSTPDAVYYGYTPGYLGAYVWDDTVVFGTGWYYPGWTGLYWYGWPWTWGFGFDFGYFGGGWLWRPNGYWWYHNPGYLGRVYNDHWNPHWAPGDRERISNNVNVYNRWGGNTVAARNFGPTGAAARPSSASSGRDMYAGRDGNVYERQNNNTWTQRNNAGAARTVRPSEDLQRAQQSRSLGESRMGEFGRSGISSGFPRSMPSGGFGGGGFHGGGGRR
jgi:hypothetical protein